MADPFPEMTFCHEMDYHAFHRLDWMNETDAPYRREGFEVDLPPEVMHTSRIAMIEGWMRETCRGRWASRVRYVRVPGIDYVTFLRFSDENDAVLAKLRWA